MGTEKENNDYMKKAMEKMQETCSHLNVISMIPSIVWVGGFPESIIVRCTICDEEKVYVPEEKDAR